MGRKRATKAERELRIDTLMGLKAKGYTFSQLVQAGMAYWHISEREVKRYLSEVKNREREGSLLPSCERFEQLALKYQYLYAKAVAEDNAKLALDIANSQLHLEEIRLKHQPTRGGHHDTNASSRPALPDTNELERLMAVFENEKPPSSA